MAPRSTFDFDAVVVGAGAVGLATAYALGRRGLEVAVMEREPAIGQGVSSRNSEVIHAGLYYPTGSLKARLCIEGRRLLYAFLEDHAVAFDRCGKLVVATDDSEIPRLDAVFAHAMANGVEGVERLTGQAARELEPALSCVAAITSHESGVFDSHGYMLALLGEIETRGGVLARRTPFLGARALQGGGFAVSAGGDEASSFSAERLVLAPGLGAQAAAATIADYPLQLIPPLHLGKGVYFHLIGKPPFSRLIYPPPIPGALGSHYRRDMGGQARFGPDLAYVEAETYDVDPARSAGFYRDIRRYWPGLPDGALEPDYAGIRPKLHGPGEPQPDFRIDGEEVHGLAGLVTLFGIESPGLTSSLAIGEAVAERLERTQSSPVPR